MNNKETTPDLRDVKKRVKRINKYLSDNEIKHKALVKLTGKPKQTVSMILSMYRVPLYVDGFLKKIEKHYSLN